MSDLANHTTLLPTRTSRPRTERRGPHLLPEARTHLRAALVVSDAVAIALAWSLTLLMWPASGRTPLTSAVLAAAFTVAGVVILNANGLYRTRNCAIRSIELARIIRSCFFLGVVAWTGTRAVHIQFGKRWLYGQATVGTMGMALFLIASRSAYRAWLTAARRDGNYARNVVIIGANSEAAELTSLLSDHPDMGLRVVGLLGDRDAAIAHGQGGAWCGPIENVGSVLVARKATGVIVTNGALPPERLDALVASLEASGAHIHLSLGVRRMDYRRLRALPIAYQPLLYVEPAVLARWQVAVKRAIDLAVSVVVLTLTAPVLAVIALTVKLQDGGPVFFRQQRVGRDGRLFGVLKFRTMVVDAEARLAALATQNERYGPLFKMDNDPRVTRIGRFLRDSSLDELPQLINVLKGEMSIVGPRPALPREVETFDAELLERTRVRPGITGLWQVEARDNPSFAAYRRLDLYYVDNWSVGLDGVIIVATIEQVIARFAGVVLRRRSARPETTALRAGSTANGGVPHRLCASDDAGAAE